MSQIAILRWQWSAVAPLVTGYSQNLAEAAGEIERGQRTVVNVKTHNPEGQLSPSFMVSSIKGVFRSAAAWLVERTAREQQAQSYITCDYGLAVPESWRPRLGIRQRATLCPVCRVFGGSGCLGESDVAPASRLKAPVNFSFNRANDATYGSVKRSPPYRFAWEQIENQGQKLQVEQLQFEPETILEARLEPASDFAVALILLSADLISSGFFRFGRFTTRGYGIVRLLPATYFMDNLTVLLMTGEVAFQSAEGMRSGVVMARKLIRDDPFQTIRKEINNK